MLIRLENVVLVNRELWSDCVEDLYATALSKRLTEAGINDVILFQNHKKLQNGSLFVDRSLHNVSRSRELVVLTYSSVMAARVAQRILNRIVLDWCRK